MVEYKEQEGNEIRVWRERRSDGASLVVYSAWRGNGYLSRCQALVSWHPVGCFSAATAPESEVLITDFVDIPMAYFARLGGYEVPSHDILYLFFSFNFDLFLIPPDFPFVSTSTLGISFQLTATWCLHCINILLIDPIILVYLFF